MFDIIYDIQVGMSKGGVQLKFYLPTNIPIGSVVWFVRWLKQKDVNDKIIWYRANQMGLKYCVLEEMKIYENC